MPLTKGPYNAIMDSFFNPCPETILPTQKTIDELPTNYLEDALKKRSFIIFYSLQLYFFLHSQEKNLLKSTFFPWHVKKSYPNLEVDTFEIMLLLFFKSLRVVKKLVHDFKSPLLELEKTCFHFKTSLIFHFCLVIINISKHFQFAFFKKSFL